MSISKPVHFAPFRAFRGQSISATSFPSCTWERTCLRSCASSILLGCDPGIRQRNPTTPASSPPPSWHGCQSSPPRRRRGPRLRRTGQVVAGPWARSGGRKTGEQAEEGGRAAVRCDILVESLEYCRKHKTLRISAWVILDNHFHAILAAPDLPRVMADFKRHTAQRIIGQLEAARCEWLLNQLRYFRAAHTEETLAQAAKQSVLLRLRRVPQVDRCSLSCGLLSKSESEHSVWQEGFHPQGIVSDEMMVQSRAGRDRLRAEPQPEGWRRRAASTASTCTKTRSSAAWYPCRSTGGIHRRTNGPRVRCPCCAAIRGGSIPTPPVPLSKRSSTTPPALHPKLRPARSHRPGGVADGRMRIRVKECGA